MGLIVWRIAWVESLAWTTRRSTYAVALGLTALVWISASVGADDVLSRRQEYASQLTSIAAEQVKPRSLAGTGVERVLRLARPPEVASILVRGDDARLPPYFDFGPAGVLWGQRVVTDTVPMLAGALLDVESILRVLGGLIAVLVGAQVIGWSRVRGQLHAWQTLGIDPAIGMIGKLLGCALVLTAGALLALAVAAGASTWHLQEAAAFPAFALGAMPILVFLWTLAAAGAAAALWTRTLAQASIAGVALWATVSMVGPQISASAPRLLVPNQTRASMESLRDQIFSDDIRAAEQALGDIASGSLASWNGNPPPLVIDAVVAEHWKAMEESWSADVREARVSAQVAERTWNAARHRQVAIGHWLGFATPGACLIRAVTALAGTGNELSEGWYSYAEHRQQQLNNALFDDRPQPTVRVLGRLTIHRRHNALRWSELPAAPTQVVASSLGDARGPLTGLVAYLGVAVAAAAAGARRAASVP